MSLSIYCDHDRLWGTHPVGPGEASINQLVQRFFIFDDLPVRAWLVVDRVTGQGLAVAVSAFYPLRKKIAKMNLPIDVIEVEATEHDVLVAYTPKALLWEGRNLVALGH